MASGARVTWFLPEGDPQAARKRWIAAMKPRGELMVDAGAAMALAQETPLLLMDEPTTFLDIAHQVELLDLFAELNREHGHTVVAVLHDLVEAYEARRRHREPDWDEIHAQDDAGRDRT